MTDPSTRPYLIRALHEWCTDNGFRPYLVVSVDSTTIVPREFVRGGEIILNVSLEATNKLRLGNDLIEFEARFGGVARQISVPVANVSAIYAAENGQGMAFEMDVSADRLRPDPEPSAAPGAPAAAAIRPLLTAAPATEAAQPPESPEPPSPRGPGGRPTLTRVK